MVCIPPSRSFTAETGPAYFSGDFQFTCEWGFHSRGSPHGLIVLDASVTSERHTQLLNVYNTPPFAIGTMSQMVPINGKRKTLNAQLQVHLWVICNQDHSIWIRSSSSCPLCKESLNWERHFSRKFCYSSWGCCEELITALHSVWGEYNYGFICCTPSTMQRCSRK